MPQHITTLSINLTSPKVLLFDLDGTIVRSDHTISPSIISTLSKLKSRGVKIGLATGRAHFGATSIIKELDITDPSMFFSGSLVISPGSEHISLEAPLSEEALMNLINDATSNNLYTELYTATSYFSEYHNHLTAMHAEYMGFSSEIVSYAKLMKQHSILKVVLMAERGAEEEKLRALVARHHTLSCGLSFGAAHSGLLFANFTSSHASRENAWDVMLKEYKVTPDEVASFGDAEADLPFLTRAKYGIAMGNAPLSVQQRAPFITDSVEDDGVLTSLMKLFPDLN